MVSCCFRLKIEASKRERMKSEEAMTELREAIIAIAKDAVAGAAYGGIGGMLIMARCRNPQVRTQCARICARNASATFAAWTGTECLVKGVRGKDDLTTQLVAGSGGGLAYSFVSQGLKPKPANALFNAAVYAVMSGSIFKVKETIRARSEDSTKGKAFDT